LQDLLLSGIFLFPYAPATVYLSDIFSIRVKTGDPGVAIKTFECIGLAERGDATLSQSDALK
jgi:hypothetical protein